MKTGISTKVTTGIITATRSFIFSVILHIILFIALSFFLSLKFHSDRQKVDVYLEVAFIPVEEQQPVPRLSRGIAKPVVSVKSSFPPIKNESTQKAPRGFLSADKPASQGKIRKAVSKIGQGMKELPVGTGVNVNGGGEMLSGARRGEEILPTAGVERGLEIGKGDAGLADGVSELAKGGGGMDLKMNRVERLKPVMPQREKFGKQTELSMLGDVGAADANDTLANVTKDMILDRTGFGVSKLPKGEPGGVVIGRGKDIRGYLRFPRFTCSMVDDRIVQHFVGKALPNLIKWLNAKTNIKVDMNVEGGRVSPLDATLFKSPIVFLFGQDEMIASIFSGSEPPTWASYNNFIHLPLPRASKHLTKMEKERIRKYLLEKGGILFIDTQPRINALAKKGQWAPGRSYPWSMRMKRELRTILPEYNLKRIPNEHELFHCYYELGGAPPGHHYFCPAPFSQFWHAKTPYLEGISVDGHLAVIYSEMEYWGAMIPDKSYPIKPSVFRFLTNTVVYALTHSGVSDKSRYVPEKEIPGEIPKKPPLIPQPTPNLRQRR